MLALKVRKATHLWPLEHMRRSEELEKPRLAASDLLLTT